MQLDDWNLLEDLLDSSRFFEIGLGIRGNTEREAAKTITIQFLRRTARFEDYRIAPQTKSHAGFLSILWTMSEGDIYKTKANWEALQGRLNRFRNEDWNDFNEKFWQPITTLFSGEPGKQRIEDLVESLDATWIANETDRSTRSFQSIRYPILVRHIAETHHRSHRRKVGRQLFQHTCIQCRLREYSRRP